MPAPRWFDHALACGLTLMGVPLAGVMLIFAVAPLGDLALPVGVFGILLATTALSAWIALIPGAVLIALLWQRGGSHPALSVALGAGAAAGLALGEGSSGADLAAFCAIGALYGATHRMILGALAGTSMRLH